MNDKLVIRGRLVVGSQGRRRRVGANQDSPSPVERVPRVARLMALAIHCDERVRSGALRDYAEIARLGHVSRARVSQIMNLLLLANDIQEQILLLPPIQRGRDPLKLADLQSIARLVDWSAQRKRWRNLLRDRR